MNLEVFLSLFTIMLVSLAVYVIAQKTKLPYTVLLVISGSLLVPLSKLDTFSFITSFELTPELLFFVFLPILIFESAYNIKISSMLANVRTISILSIGSLLVSTFFIGISAHFVFKWIGFDIPFIVTLLFGAIISAIDPVAVLALFKDYGAPRRLTLIFEGESLFNDGTAFALFLVFLEIMMNGFDGYHSVLSGIISFFVMVVGGIIFGLLMGFLFAKMIEWIQGNEHLEITLTLLVAHFTFILTELIADKLVIAGHHVHFSSIIATLVASMIVGNYGRFKMSVGVEEYMERFWGYFGFVTNSLVFILMGLLFIEQSVALYVVIGPILISIILVMIGRALSIYPLLGLLNATQKEEPIPLSWMHLLSWGSLRGAIAVIMVMLIPDDVTVSGWDYAFTVKEFIMSITIGCIYFTLLIKATTIGKVMKRLGIDNLTEYEEVSYFKSKALIYDEALSRLESLQQEGRLNDEQYAVLRAKYHQLHEQACEEFNKKFAQGSQLTENLLKVYVLGLEKGELKEIFSRGEINEKIYKKILFLLDIQMERVEKGRAQVSSVQETFPLDGIERFINALRRLFSISTNTLSPQENYLYYRTQLKLLETVVARLEGMHNTNLGEIFNDNAIIEKTLDLYRSLIKNTQASLDKMVESNLHVLTLFNAESAEKALILQEADTLHYLSQNEIITPKLNVMLQNELSVVREKMINKTSS